MNKKKKQEENIRLKLNLKIELSGLKYGPKMIQDLLIPNTSLVISKGDKVIQVSPRNWLKIFYPHQFIYCTYNAGTKFVARDKVSYDAPKEVDIIYKI